MSPIPHETSDDDLLGQAKREKRTLLTRDKRLAETCQSQAIECILIRSSHLPEQLLEMAQRGILLELNPQRCTLCNCPLQEVESPERRTWICTGCKRAILERQPLEKYGEDAGEHSLGVRTIHQYVVPDASVTVFLLFIGHEGVLGNNFYFYIGRICVIR